MNEMLWFPHQWSANVPYYRAYIIRRDGHFQKTVELDCADDNAAIEQAKQLVDGHDVELCQHGHRVARFEADTDVIVLGSDATSSGLLSSR
jgi:hypothetical protein